jgi:hypothetical protein
MELKILIKMKQQGLDNSIIPRLLGNNELNKLITNNE